MRLLVVPILLLAAAVPAVAAAEPPGEPAEDEGFHDRFLLETGRIEPAPPDPAALRFNIHGEYQLRYRAQTNLGLTPPIGQPGVDALGQRQMLYHWLRVGLRLDVFDRVALYGQIDVPRGMIAGDVTQSVDASRDSFAEARWYEVHPRALYVEVTTPVGVISRIGVVMSCTLSRLSAPAHTPLSRSIRFAPGGYVGMTFSSRSGRSANCTLMYSASSIRTISFAMLTTAPLGS